MRLLVCGSLLFALFLLLPFVVLAGYPAHPPKPAILLVAFGTTVPEAQTALTNLENRVRQRFSNVEIRWAYTAQQVRDALRRNGTQVDSPALALARLADDGFTHVAIQSLHVIPGEEFHGLVATAERFRGMPKGLTRIALGQPLLADTEDVAALAKALAGLYPPSSKTDATIFFGHGTHHGADVFYTALEYALQRTAPGLFVTTVEGSPSLEDTANQLATRGIRSARLVPLMAVAGDHALNDMAGTEESSLASLLQARKITPKPELRGLADVPPVAEIWIRHLEQAWEALGLAPSQP